MKETNLEELKDILLDLDFEEGSRPFKTGLLLLASLIVGTDVDDLVEYTGLCKSFIRPRRRRLVSNGVWLENGRVDVEWGDEGAGTTSFFLDMAVADGFVERVQEKESEMKR